TRSSSRSFTRFAAVRQSYWVCDRDSPDKGNAIDERMAAALAEAATQIAERPDVRAVLITGNGPNFTVGGDLGLFAGSAREQLPNRLRRMIDSYHLAIERLTSIDAPVF